MSHDESREQHVIQEWEKVLDYDQSPKTIEFYEKTIKMWRTLHPYSTQLWPR